MLERLLLIITGVMIIASIWMTSERRPKPPHQENTPGGGLSADFVALISAVHNEALTNRQEQQGQEQRKAVREFINIFILTATLIALAITCKAIISQVDEMKKAYVTVSDQAKTSADTERRQLSAFITVNDIHVDKTINDNKEFIHATLVPIIENGGQTAAREVLYWLGYTSAVGPLAPDHPPAGSNLILLTHLGGMRASIGPRSKYDRTFSSLGIGQPQLEHVMSQQTIVYLLGSISYKDVFGSCHLTNFCFIIGKKAPNAVPNERATAFCDGDTNCTDEECQNFKPC
jgi:hypothetical protein